MNGHETLTGATLALIVIAVVVVLIVIWWGSKLARRRHAAEREILADRGRHENPAPVVEAKAEAPPVAPSPPPLADTEVVAAAPFEAAPAAMAVDLASPPPPPAPSVAGNDDFTRMKGVGPKLAARLNELGIISYGQIAALSPAEADALDAQLGAFKGRIGRDRWIEQAGYLAKDDRAGFEAAFGKL